MPINWRTPHWYLFILICEAATAFYTCLFFSASSCFFLGSCWMLISFVEDITNDVPLLNEPDEGPNKIKANFYNLLRSYSDAKQSAIELNDICRLINTGLFVWTTTTICSSLLVLQVRHYFSTQIMASLRLSKYSENTFFQCVPKFVECLESN